jgi:3-methyladenine DNA glycosylase AlkD
MTRSDSLLPLYRSLDELADPAVKRWSEQYLKGVIPYRGVKMGGVRDAVNRFISTLPPDPSLIRSIAFDLLEGQFAEDKLAGILILREHLIPLRVLDTERDLQRIEDLFTGEHIFDWSTCDWLCVKVLSPLIDQGGSDVAVTVSRWKNSPLLWLRRASNVSFVPLAKRGEKNFPGFVELMLQICDTTLRSSERFSQTGTGWLLRELSLAAHEEVIDFIRARITQFSREGLRYAIEKMGPDTQRALLDLHRPHGTKRQPASR